MEKEKIIQLVPIQGTFLSDTRAGVIALTNYGRIFYTTFENEVWEEYKNLPDFT